MAKLFRLTGGRKSYRKNPCQPSGWGGEEWGRNHQQAMGWRNTFQPVGFEDEQGMHVSTWLKIPEWTAKVMRPGKWDEGWSVGRQWSPGCGGHGRWRGGSGAATERGGKGRRDGREVDWGSLGGQAEVKFTGLQAFVFRDGVCVCTPSCDCMCVS